jgi:hypothetical protein
VRDPDGRVWTIQGPAEPQSSSVGAP